MTTLQTDILEIYNSLVIFSNDTLKSNFPKPIKVWYEKDSRTVTFEQGGKTVRSGLLVYYCLALEDLKKPTYLLPKDYDYLMYNMLNAINSGKLLEDRTCLSPENFGFDIFSVNMKEMYKGPDVIASMRIISGNSWFFKLRTKFKYSL